MTDDSATNATNTPSPGEFIRQEMKARKWTQGASKNNSALLFGALL